MGLIRVARGAGINAATSATIASIMATSLLDSRVPMASVEVAGQTPRRLEKLFNA